LLIEDQQDRLEQVSRLQKMEELSLSYKITVKPVLKTTSEQWPPVYNNQPESHFSKFESNLYEHPDYNNHLLNKLF
jgi:hypothetical protein